MQDLRHYLATTGALLTCAVLAATTWAWVSDEAGQGLTAFAEQRLPPLIALSLLVAASATPLGILASSEDVIGAMGLALAGIATLLPLWAAWPDLNDRWRALALAAGPLAAVGLVLVARSWVGAGLAASAGLLHALAYDPFRDVGCARVCLEVPAALPMTTVRMNLLVSICLTLAAALALRSALHHPGLPVPAAVGAVVLAAIGVVRWLTTGNPDAYAALLLAAVPVPGLVSLVAALAWARVASRRLAVRRLAHHLAEDPHGLLELGTRIDTSLLSPGQQLALRNAQLAAEARTRLVEVRASQRRVVATADAERRRIERDLHDGVQQRLVGVLMQLSGRGLVEVEDQIRTVLADLRSFSHGMFPAVLEEEGLEAALVELAATSNAELRMDIQLTDPVPLDQARAVYALVSLASSGTADVTLSTRDDGVEVTITGKTEADLGAVQDRFGALGGTLETTAQTVRGNLPCVW